MWGLELLLENLCKSLVLLPCDESNSQKCKQAAWDLFEILCFHNVPLARESFKPPNCSPKKVVDLVRN